MDRKALVKFMSVQLVGTILTMVMTSMVRLTGGSSMDIPPSETSAESPQLSSANRHLDKRFIVGIGTENEESIFCLGSVISPKAILTLASCFEEYDYELDVSDDSKKLSARRARKVKKKEEKNEPDVDVRPQRREDSASDDTHDPQYAAVDDPFYDDPESQESERKVHRLYRIDEKTQSFVRLRVDGTNHAEHANYKMPKIYGLQLWQHDVAVLHTKKKMDFTEVRAIPPAMVSFDDYAKTLNEPLMNGMMCQVIGLIEYANNDSYKAADARVQLVTHEVLMVYDKCDNEICRAERDLCRDTGHHILKDPANPLPHFVRGSPLVCQGLLLSAINTHSRCDDVKYSAEFPSSQSIRHLLKHLKIWSDEGLRGLLKFDFPKIPYPNWRKRSGSAALRTCVNWALELAVAVSWMTVHAAYG